MGLLSLFRRRSNAADAAPGPGGASDEIAMARTRARRRLVGAAVLVMIGVVGFPLVFESQPRPVPVDISIEIPRKDGAPALEMPPARSPAARASSPVVASARDEPASPESGDAPRAAATTASAGQVAPVAASAPEPRKARPEPARAASTAVASTDSARAKALLEGKAEAKAPPAAVAKAEPARDGGRYVVQAGAFADAAAAREMRVRLEKLGLKSYTQVVETSSGSRTRVRAGPYETREDAEKALVKAKAAGIGAVVLTL